MKQELPLSIEEVFEEVKKIISHSETNINYKLHDCSEIDEIYCNIGDFVVQMFYKGGYNLVTLDHRDCYNKASQNPISFSLPLDEETKEQLKKELDYLMTEEGKADSNKLSWGWNNFSQDVRDNFYDCI